MILFFRFLKNRCFCHDRMCSPVRGLMWGEDFYQKACFHVKIFDLHHKVLEALTSCYGVIIVFVKISPARKLNTGFYQWPIFCLKTLYFYRFKGLRIQGKGMKSLHTANGHLWYAVSWPSKRRIKGLETPFCFWAAARWKNVHELTLKRGFIGRIYASALENFFECTGKSFTLHSRKRCSTTTYE